MTPFALAVGVPLSQVAGKADENCPVPRKGRPLGLIAVSELMAVPPELLAFGDRLMLVPPLEYPQMAQSSRPRSVRFTRVLPVARLPVSWAAGAMAGAPARNVNNSANPTRPPSGLMFFTLVCAPRRF